MGRRTKPSSGYGIQELLDAPSSDSPQNKAEATRTRAERRAEAKAKRKDDVARNRGRQPGALGENLAMRPYPNEIVDHEPASCGSCGNDLTDAPVEGIERRQVFDTPVAVVSCTEHGAVAKRCTFGATTKGAFPAAAKAPTNYGPNVRASALLHVDETFDQVETDQLWFHVAPNQLYTFLVASTTRGKSAPDEKGVLPDFRGTMVHDRLTYAVCLARITCELAAVGTAWDQGRANDMAALLSEMNTTAHGVGSRGSVTFPVGCSPGSSAATTNWRLPVSPPTRNPPDASGTPWRPPATWSPRW